MKRFGVILVAMSLFLAGVGVAAADQPVRFGVLAKRGAEKAMQQWGATGEYLSKKIHRDVRIVPLKFVEIEPALRDHSIDFLLANSAFFAEFQEKYGLKAIVTMVNKKGIVALDKFGGVIFTRKDSHINDLQDIKGKRFMCVKFSSFGGAHMALRLLKESGINPEKDCSAFTEGGTHDNVVMAVLNHKTDVGTVRSDTLERMAAEGKISLDSFKIINEVKDGFQFIHSTRLYPEWPVAACGNADPKVVRSVAKALMLATSKDKAMTDAKVYAWNYPSNYNDVKVCLRVIGRIK
jgi:two-component system, LuxR family, sensor histidine kinase TtrS